MLKNNGFWIVLTMVSIFLWSSCREPDARRPVSAASGSYLKQNIRNAQELLAADTLAINAYIAQLDSVTIKQSPNGFKYFFHQPTSTDTVTPRPGQTVLLTYAISDLQNRVIYDTASVGKVKYVVDKEKLFEGFREAVKLLPEGQRATFFFPSALAYGSRGDGEKITPNQPIICTLSLLEIKSEK